MGSPRRALTDQQTWPSLLPPKEGSLCPWHQERELVVQRKSMCWSSSSPLECHPGQQCSRFAGDYRPDRHPWQPFQYLTRSQNHQVEAGRDFGIQTCCSLPIAPEGGMDRTLAAGYQNQKHTIRNCQLFAYIEAVRLNQTFISDGKRSLCVK